MSLRRSAAFLISQSHLRKRKATHAVGVKKFKPDNERYRYLLPEEEPVLMSVLTGKREHLKGMITVALGLGLRKREQLNLRRDQVDLSRNVVVATKTKGSDLNVKLIDVFQLVPK